jgi:ADP-ribose pyrophosphatase YjhB (NUDIX family)
MSERIPDHWLAIAKRINSISQSGLTFTKDPYDRERYTELLNLSLKIINNITKIDTNKLDFVFNRDIGYQTPKVGVRAVVFKDNEVLMVKEKMDHKWCLPGGYADTGMTPSETLINEVKEKSGYDVRPSRILGIIDYNKHQHRPFPFDRYQIFMDCEIIGGEAKAGIETDEVGFYSIDNLPELSERRVTRSQIIKMFELHKDKNLEPIFD